MRVDRNLLTIAAVLTGTVVVAIGSATAANGKLPPPPPPLLHHVQWSIDIQRITQGLEHDFSANVDYDKIAGKDVLVRV